MDDAPLSSDGSPDNSDLPVSPRKPPRNQRLGRGLKNMLRQPETAEQASDCDVASSATVVVEEPTAKASAKGRIVHDEAAPTDVNSPNESGIKSDTPANEASNLSKKMKPSTTAGVVEDAVSLFASYDDRFASLSGQLEAACNLLADQRALEVRRARRSSHIAWAAVAVFVILGMIGLWRAGETIGGQRTEIRQINTQASLLSGQLSTSSERIAELRTNLNSAAAAQSNLRSELNDMRSALTKANLVIDQWMERAHSVEETQADQTKKTSPKAE